MIIDGNSKVLAEAGQEERFIVADITPSECAELRREDIPRGKWLTGFNRTIRFMAGYSELTGRVRYRLSHKRRKAARQTNC